jgi:hypothetical protein
MFGLFKRKNTQLFESYLDSQLENTPKIDTTFEVTTTEPEEDKKPKWLVELENSCKLDKISHLNENAYSEVEIENLECGRRTVKLFSTIKTLKSYRKDNYLLISPEDLKNILQENNLIIGALDECMHHIPDNLAYKFRKYNIDSQNILSMTINNLHKKIGLRRIKDNIGGYSSQKEPCYKATPWYKHNIDVIPEYYPDEKFVKTHQKHYGHFLLGKDMVMCGDDLWKTKEKTECVLFYFDELLECFVFYKDYYWEIDYKKKAKTFDEYKRDVQRSHGVQLEIDFSNTNKTLDEISEILEGDEIGDDVGGSSNEDILEVINNLSNDELLKVVENLLTSDATDTGPR